MTPKRCFFNDVYPFICLDSMDEIFERNFRHQLCRYREQCYPSQWKILHWSTKFDWEDATQVNSSYLLEISNTNILCSEHFFSHRVVINFMLWSITKTVPYALSKRFRELFFQLKQFKTGIKVRNWSNKNLWGKYSSIIAMTERWRKMEKVFWIHQQLLSGSNQCWIHKRLLWKERASKCWRISELCQERI